MTVDLAARRSGPFDIGCAMVTTVLLVLVGLDVSSPVRVLLALAFVSFVPGWALLGLVPPLRLVALVHPITKVTMGTQGEFVGHVPLVQGVSRIAMAVALSLTLCTASAQAVLWLHLWYPSAVLGALGILSLLALAVRFVQPPPPTLSWEPR